MSAMKELKYKPGDKFIIEIEKAPDYDWNSDYRGTTGVVMDEKFLDGLERYDEAKIVRKAIQRRIDKLTAMVTAFEKERDALCEYINRKDGDGLG